MDVAALKERGALIGTPNEIAEGLLAFDAVGVQRIMAQLADMTDLDGVELLGIPGASATCLTIGRRRFSIVAEVAGRLATIRLSTRIPLSSTASSATAAVTPNRRWKSQLSTIHAPASGKSVVNISTTFAVAKYPARFTAGATSLKYWKFPAPWNARLRSQRGETGNQHPEIESIARHPIGHIGRIA